MFWNHEPVPVNGSVNGSGFPARAIRRRRLRWMLIGFFVAGIASSAVARHLFGL